MTAVDKFDEMTYIDPYADVPHPGDDGSVIGQPPAGIRSRLLKMIALRNLPQPATLITSLMDVDTLALLYGRRGSYKSFFALDWAMCVAYGRRWHSQAVTAGPVLYVCAEGAHGVDQRIDAWKRHNGVIGDTDELDSLPEAIKLLSPSSAGELADVARDIGARLVILDTWARCTVGGEENSTKDMGLAIEQADVIRRRSGACVLAVHHSGKDSTAGARCSSALEAAFDSVFEVSATDDVVIPPRYLVSDAGTATLPRCHAAKRQTAMRRRDNRSIYCQRHTLPLGGGSGSHPATNGPNVAQVARPNTERENAEQPVSDTPDTTQQLIEQKRSQR